MDKAKLESTFIKFANSLDKAKGVNLSDIKRKFLDPIIDQREKEKCVSDYCSLFIDE